MSEQPGGHSRTRSGRKVKTVENDVVCDKQVEEAPIENVSAPRPQEQNQEVDNSEDPYQGILKLKVKVNIVLPW